MSWVSTCSMCGHVGDDFVGKMCPACTIIAAKDAEIARLRESLQVDQDELASLQEFARADRAEIAGLRAALAERTQQRDHEAWLNAACLTIAETGEKWGDGVHPSLAMREVWELRQGRDLLRDIRKDLCEERERLQAELAALQSAIAPEGSADYVRQAEIHRVQAGVASEATTEAAKLRQDLAALREAVGALPWYRNCSCPTTLAWGAPDCEHDTSNAALAAARKLAGLGE